MPPPAGRKGPMRRARIGPFPFLRLARAPQRFLGAPLILRSAPVAAIARSGWETVKKPATRRKQHPSSDVGTTLVVLPG